MKQKQNLSAIRRHFIAACHEAANRGLLMCSNGNLSWRVDAERLLATRMRSWLGAGGVA